MSKTQVTITMQADDLEIRWILGQPCFVLRETADMLRANGYEVARRAEDEQAVSLFWMLGLYSEHGETWREKAQEQIVAYRESLQ